MVTVEPSAPEPTESQGDPTSGEQLGEISPAVQSVATASAGEAPDDSVKKRILTLVVEKTGYPKDMLDLDLDLEADLGVDTVKQVEMFAAIREIYNIPRDPNLKLRDFPTLAHVIQFVYDRRPDLSLKTPITESNGETAPHEEPQVESVSPEAQPQIASDEEIKTKVLDIVAAKTGYPKDMLDLDLDLEADLGVDTVKQAEMFAEVRAAYNIPRDPDLKLRDFPTLAHVIQFAKTKLASMSEPVSKQEQPASEAIAYSVNLEKADEVATPARSARAQPELASFEAADRIPRRVPVPVPRPPLDACKTTGVKLGQGSRVIIMPDQQGVAAALSDRLRALGAEVTMLEPASDPGAIEERVKAAMGLGPVQGVYWLPALDDEGSLSDMTVAEWKNAIGVRVKTLYATMRVLYDHIAVQGTFYVAATRLGGQHGYDEQGAVAPLGGAVVGFTKTYKRERPDALVKAVDFERDARAAEIVSKLLEEAQRDAGAVEIGHKHGQRWTIGLQERPASDGVPGLTLDENTVFVVTGAAGSIVSAITSDLAAASGGTFYLLDLVPEPDPRNPDLKRFVDDKDGLKRELFARIQARGERATPALVEKELAALERACAANSAIEAVRHAGGTPYYYSVNLTHAEAVAKIVSQIRERSGRIDVLLHAAGIERSHFLPDKPTTEFDLVFDVKSDGWFNLLRAIGEMPLGATVAFSSIAGRFGNAGQTDYSSANDLLCKITSSFRTTRPNTRGIVINWTAWGGIGMATRGSIPKMMEVAGIDMLPPEAGIPLIRRELTKGATRGEIVIGQRLGVLLNEWDETGGLDPKAATAFAKDGPMVGKITKFGIHSGVQVEVTLDPKQQPFLYDHQIDGTPVLPGVMGVEAFAEAAGCMLPGWYVESVEDVSFLAPFKFYRNEPRTVEVQATFVCLGEAIVAECKLIGRRQLPNQAEPQSTIHFTGRVRLSRQKPEQVMMTTPPHSGAAQIKRDDIYQIYFHGPAYQVVQRAWREGDRVIGVMAEALPPNHQPTDRPTLVTPRTIELCFQTAGLWELGVESRFGLPQRIERVRVLGDPAKAKAPLYAAATPRPDGAFDAAVVDSAGTAYLVVTGYRTVALPTAVDSERLTALRAAA